MGIKETELEFYEENEPNYKWPKNLTGCLEDVYVAKLSQVEDVTFNYVVPQGDFIGLGHIKEGQAGVHIWVNPEQIIWIAQVEPEEN